MIYVKQSYDLHPASPASRDRFVATVERYVLPANERLGARLVGAFFAHDEWFSQLIHVTEFDDFAALGRYRDAASKDGQAAEGEAQLLNLAPEQRIEIVEPLGVIATQKLHAAIAASREAPVGVYTFAVLEVAAGQMDRFAALLDAAQERLPILACWRDVSGNPNRIIDLWKGDLGAGGYEPTNEGQNAFFEPLRQVAPREKLMRLHALPYSSLR